MATKTVKKAAKKRKIAAPYTAKFAPAPLTERQERVVAFIKKNGPSTLQQIGDEVFKRERPASKRCSWARNQMRNIRANKLVKHTPRKGDKAATYAAANRALAPKGKYLSAADLMTLASKA